MTETMNSNDNDKDYYQQFDEDKNTQLHYAAAYNNIAQVKKVLEVGDAKVDAENAIGWTPLMMATRNGNFEVVKYLIERKADATKRNNYDASVFLLAIASGDTDLIHFILQHLLEGGVSKQSMESIMSPIAVALLFEKEPVLDYLIANSFNVNTAAPVSRITPIMISAMQNNETLFQLLISKGADPFIKNLNNQSAYEIMCSKKPRKKPSKQQPGPNQARHHQQQHHLTPGVGQSHVYNYNQNLLQPHLHMCPQQHHPVFLSPQCYNKPVQMIYLTPPSNFCNSHPGNHHSPVLKSPNVAAAPYFMMPPGPSPISPIYGHHPVFFSQNFSPNQVQSPANPCQTFTYDDACGNNHGRYTSEMNE